MKPALTFLGALAAAAVAVWRETFAAEKHAGLYPFIAFEGIGEQNSEGSGNGWDGGLLLPRVTAIEMMCWLEKRARQELSQMGVTL